MALFGTAMSFSQRSKLKLAELIIRSLLKMGVGVRGFSERRVDAGIAVALKNDGQIGEARKHKYRMMMTLDSCVFYQKALHARTTA